MINPKATRQLYVWHKWTGLVSGLFLFFVCFTGVLVVFKHEIDAALTPGMSVPARSAPHAPLETLLGSMERAYPKSRVGMITLADGRTDTHKISIRDGRKNREVFLDPYTGEISGSRTGQNLANILRQTHLRFYFYGWKGRVAVGIVGLALVLSSITGILIYYPFMKKLTFGRIRWKERLKLVYSDLHKFIGFVTLIFNLVIGLTGAALGLENLQRYSPAAKQILHPAPSAEDRKPRPDSIEGRLTVDQAIAAADRALPGFRTVSVTLPRADRAHWMLRGDAGPFVNEGSSWMILDTHTGAPIAMHDARKAHILTKAYNLSEPLHFGDFAGIPMRVLYALLGLASSALTVTGFGIWILKTASARRARKQKAVKQSGG